MPYVATYAPEGPSREQVDGMRGPVLVEFGTDWCGFCQAAQPALRELLGQHGEIAHLKVEDGPGRPLGRSFGVRLWPTLVFMRDGQVVTRVSRPDRSAMEAGFNAVSPSS